MSTYISAVNQKLLFARQLLRLVGTTRAAVSTHQTTAIAQSIVVQLHQAWLWHCCNIAESYKLKEPQSVTDGNALVVLLAEQGKCPGEATELQTLENEPHSWLSELLNAHGHIYRLPVVRKAEMDVDRLPIIALDAPTNIEWSLERVELWLQNLQELVERQREMMVEF